MHFDLLIVGGGPSGLAAAIRAAQQARKAGQTVSICLLDKGAEIGAHILSGAVMDVRALQTLLPDWRETGAPLDTYVSDDILLWLNQDKAWRIPHGIVPACLHNNGHLIGSLGLLCRWLAKRAEALGVEIYAGFAATEILYDAHGAVAGVTTGDMGLRRDGSKGPQYAEGINLMAHYTLFAEGARGHLGKRLEQRFGLRQGIPPQSFSLGIKELWQIPQAQHRRGSVIHTAGWPLPDATGGGFLYHYGKDLVAVGLISSLGYRNPWFSPFDEFQRLKTHPAIHNHLKDGKRLEYGARVLTAGGPQAMPGLVFPGGALIGDNAGFLDAARLKGIHGAMSSGMMAADAAIRALGAGRSQDILQAYPESWHKSVFAMELRQGRNFKPLASLHRWLGPVLATIDQTIMRGHAPWTLQPSPAPVQMMAANSQPRISYPSSYRFPCADRASSVFLSNLHYTEDQPCHLKLQSAETYQDINLGIYAAPEVRYCPAGVYELLRDQDQKPRLQINAGNCLHCKACDIKDPAGNIEWTPSQGGEGPLYTQM